MTKSGLKVYIPNLMTKILTRKEKGESEEVSARALS